MRVPVAVAVCCKFGGSVFGTFFVFECRYLGVWPFNFWGFQGGRKFPLAKLSLANLSPGEICPPPPPVVLWCRVVVRMNCPEWRHGVVGPWGRTVRCACAVPKVGYLGPILRDDRGDRGNYCVPIHRTVQALTQSKSSDTTGGTNWERRKWMRTNVEALPRTKFSLNFKDAVCHPGPIRK